MTPAKASMRDWLPLAREAKAAAPPPSGEAFHPDWFDLEHGIRVGNLEPHERITQILKGHLEQTYRTPFITDRWGRGVYWQWICWLPRANRAAKPISAKVNFGCAKLFVTLDRTQKTVRAGLQVERGYAEPPEPYPGCLLQPDWDWHRLVEQCREGSPLDHELNRLIRREGFVAEVGDWTANAVFAGDDYHTPRQIREVLAGYPRRQWVGFQLYYPMPIADVHRGSGLEVVCALCAAFDEVVPAMNACMQVPLQVAAPTADEVQAGLGGPAGTFRRRHSAG